MALILAIQPDSSYTSELRQALCGSTDTEVVVTDTLESALAAIDANLPDLVLVDALTPPAEVTDVIGYLRLLPEAAHVQTISVPLIQRLSDFRRSPGLEPRPGWLRHLGKELPRQPGRPVEWDPDVFAADVGDYIARMHAVRSEAELLKAAAKRRTSERRRARRWLATDVSFTAARLVTSRVELINISVGGALLRTDVRPRPRRPVGALQYAGPTLTLYQASGDEIRQRGWPVRCHVRTIADERLLYEVAFRFEEDLELVRAGEIEPVHPSPPL